MSRYIVEPDRKQLYYDMIDVDRLVPEEHEVRRLWNFLGQLDLERVYRKYKAIEEEFGRMPIDPRVLFAVWLYGFMKGTGSSEVLAEQCRVHSEFRWICGGLKPCARTLRNFRNANRDVFDSLLTDSIAALISAGLVDLETVSQDGTTIRAACSKKSYYKAGAVQKAYEAAKERVQVLAEMSDEAARADGRRRLAAMKREAEKKMRLAQEALKKLRERREAAEGKGGTKERGRISLTEPESKFMLCKEGMKVPAYNVQIVSSRDSSPAVLGVGVFERSSDTYTLEEMIEGVAAKLSGIGALGNVLTDKGYYSGLNAGAMSSSGIRWFCSVPENQKGEFGDEVGSGYEKAHFRYDEANDVYICPEGKELGRVGREKKKNVMVTNYRCRECAGCAAREKCTDSKRGRKVQRSEYEVELRELVRRSLSEEGKELLRMRGRMSEKTNADIKERFKLRRFQVKGKAAVLGVMTMMAIAINALIWMKGAAP
jgi:transposase